MLHPTVHVVASLERNSHVGQSFLFGDLNYRSLLKHFSFVIIDLGEQGGLVVKRPPGNQKVGG